MTKENAPSKWLIQWAVLFYGIFIDSAVAQINRTFYFVLSQLLFSQFNSVSSWLCSWRSWQKWKFMCEIFCLILIIKILFIKIKPHRGITANKSVRIHHRNYRTSTQGRYCIHFSSKMNSLQQIRCIICCILSLLGTHRDEIGHASSILDFKAKCLDLIQCKSPNTHKYSRKWTHMRASVCVIAD